MSGCIRRLPFTAVSTGCRREPTVGASKPSAIGQRAYSWAVRCLKSSPLTSLGSSSEAVTTAAGRSAGLVSAPGEDPDHLTDVCRVVALGPLVEVVVEQRHRLAEPAHPSEEQPAVPTMVRVD